MGAFAVSLVPILGAIACLALPVIIAYALDECGYKLAKNRFNKFWFE
jgi:predicted PurR-regulated permease PerM